MWRGYFIGQSYRHKEAHEENRIHSVESLMMNIYVGNLSNDATSEDLREYFAEFGEVSSVKIVLDQNTGNSRGFGFVEMPDKEAARDAIIVLNGKELKGRMLTVSAARSRSARGASGESRQGGQETQTDWEQ